MTGNASERVPIAGILVDNLSEKEVPGAIRRMIARGGSHYMVVVNAAKVVAAARDSELRRVLLGADLVGADGMSVVWASRLLGRPLKARVTGIALFQRLVEYAAAQGLSVFFLGAREESVRGVVARFRLLYPSLKIAGYHNGYFASSDSPALVDSIRRSATDLLFVAMGSPSQEMWIEKNLALSGVRFALGVGGSFDHVSGHARRAPSWMQAAGLEWLFRLAREPRRLWRRYLIGNTLFVWLIAKQLIRTSR